MIYIVLASSLNLFVCGSILDIFDCVSDTVLQAQETSSTPTVDKPRDTLEEQKARVVDKVDIKRAINNIWFTFLFYNAIKISLYGFAKDPIIRVRNNGSNNILTVTVY